MKTPAELVVGGGGLNELASKSPAPIPLQPTRKATERIRIAAEPVDVHKPEDEDKERILTRTILFRNRSPKRARFFDVGHPEKVVVL